MVTGETCHAWLTHTLSPVDVTGRVGDSTDGVAVTRQGTVQVIGGEGEHPSHTGRLVTRV